MGIEVSKTNQVSINHRHENGVDTSLDGNPSRGHLKGIPLVHVFRRNHNGSRRDDGNPLIFALKGMRGFSITPFWEKQLMKRAVQIISSASEDFAEIDYCMPVPSSSPLCGKFAALVAHTLEKPIIDPTFLRKMKVGEVLAEVKANPPRVRLGLKVAFTSQLSTLERTDQNREWQAKEVDISIRHLFHSFILEGEAPPLADRHVLLVDDLFATGSSILSLRQVVQNQLGASVSAMCLLSGAR
jgi:hypothetical protein